MSKSIKNNSRPALNLPQKDIDHHLYKNANVVFDFSFHTAFASGQIGEFNNCLKDQNDFILRFREALHDIRILSMHNVNDLIISKEFRHCHKEDKGSAKAHDIISKLLKNQSPQNIATAEQMIDGEDIYQLGLNQGIRFFGTITGNIFKVCFIDYRHRFNLNPNYNDKNDQTYSFCCMTSDL